VAGREVGGWAVGECVQGLGARAGAGRGGDADAAWAAGAPPCVSTLTRSSEDAHARRSPCSRGHHAIELTASHNQREVR